jgi:hypothetical protein
MPVCHLLSFGDDAVPSLGQRGRIRGGCKRGRQQRPEPWSQVYNAESTFIAAVADHPRSGLPRSLPRRQSKFTSVRATGP